MANADVTTARTLIPTDLARHLQRQRSGSPGRKVKVLSVQYGPWLQAGTGVDRAGAVKALSTLGHLGVSAAC